MNRSTAPLRPTGILIGVAAALATVVPVASAAEVPLPSTTTPVVEEVAAPETSPVAPAPATQPAKTTRARFRVLRLGARGADVRALQRILRHRKHRIAVDGIFGRRTKRAVMRQQRRFKMSRTGVATPLFQRRLRLRPRWRPGTTSTSPVAKRANFLSVFPVTKNYTYSDDYGAPRYQGAHEGVDIMAPQGTLAVSPVAGTIMRLSRVESGLGGKWIWIRDSGGNEYYFAHFHAIARGLAAGSPVRAGQVIASIGETGDARGTTPHLHFEIHPGGGAAVNPYSELIAVDPLRK